MQSDNNENMMPEDEIKEESKPSGAQIPEEKKS